MQSFVSDMFKKCILQVGDNANLKAGEKNRGVPRQDSRLSITPPRRWEEPRSQPGYAATESDDEEELRRTMQSLLEQEEVVLDVMMKNIKVRVATAKSKPHAF